MPVTDGGLVIGGRACDGAGAAPQAALQWEEVDLAQVKEFRR